MVAGGLRIALTVDPEIPVPPTHYGGIERIVDLLARGLRERGHDVTLFANGESSAPGRLVAWSGRSSRAAGDTLLNLATLTGQTLMQRFDLVHSFSRLAYLGGILPLRVPKLMSYQREISPRTTSWAWRLSRGTLDFSAISQWMMKDVKDTGRWHLIPNGVPLRTFTFRADVAPDAPLVFLGRVEEIKGPHLAIDIARKAGRRLIIAGNVPNEHQAWFERHVVPALDDDTVRYVGPVNDGEKNEILGSAAAFLMPILWDEPFGIVMAEAMACGTPVLGLRRGSVPEVVDDGKTGFVEDTVESLVRAVRRLDQISRAACRARVELHYGDATIVGQYEALYRRMVAPHGP